MPQQKPDLTLKRASWIAGIAYLLMFATPLAEFRFHQLVNLDDADATMNNIAANLPHFRQLILLYFINFVGDIIAAWAIYILLRPVNNFLSLFAAWLRIIYTVLSLVVLFNLVDTLQWFQPHYYLKATAAQVQDHVMIALHAFRRGWSFCYLFFGLYLVVIGYLAIISKYVHYLVGICLCIAGLGWLIDNLQPYLYPGIDVNVGMFAGVGELVFMLWLFIKGTRLNEQPETSPAN